MDKNEIIYWSKRLYDKGLSPSVSGNVSVLLDDNTILISSSGSASGDLSEEDIVKIDLTGNLIEGNKKPSSEKLMHVQIYKNRPDIKAIIHSHSPEITAFSLNKKGLSKIILPEFAFHFGSVPISEYHLPSSMELALDVGEKFKNHNAVLMKNHGVTVGGKNLKEAFYSLEMIQANCKTLLLAKTISKIDYLNKKQLKEIEELKTKTQQ